MPDVTPMKVATTEIDGLVIITMKQVADERGVVREFYRESSWTDAGLPSLGPWLQVNLTDTRAGAVRGLHAEAMSKLVAVASGRAFGAYVDTRSGSATYGRVVTVALDQGKQVLVPDGVANGFQALTDTQYLYCFDVEWVPGMAGLGVHPLDPALAIDWPLPIDTSDPSCLSAKDAAQSPLPDGR
ncbi:MAG: dTDP-4-dehydrorhamnose 3,5-epimerase family protein [Acidimicrobiales bacterium]